MDSRQLTRRGISTNLKVVRPEEMEVITKRDRQEIGRARFVAEARRRNWHRFIFITIGSTVLAGGFIGLIVALVVRGSLPSFPEFSDSLVAKMRQAFRQELAASKADAPQPIQVVTMTPEIEKAIENKFEQLGLQAARNSPIVKEKEARIAAQQKMIDGLSKAKRNAEAELKQVSAKYAEANDQLDLVQQKLELASDKDREGIVKDAVAHLSRDDVEALLLLEKLSVGESRGRMTALGPWVPMYIYVPQRDRNGKAILDKNKKYILVRKVKPGPYNPWVRIKNGIPHDRAYGFAQMMGENIPAWSEEATGIRYTPDQLLKEPDVYRKVALYQIRKYLKMYNHNPDDVFSAWHSGRPLKKAKNSRDANLATPEYVRQAKSANIADPTVWKNARRSGQ